MRSALRLVIALVVLLLPATLFAQGSLAGIVRDNTGAVLPGVTVSAASPALIEKSKSTVTDGNGQYRIVDLRPGTYELTFTLAGFSTIRRQNIELEGSQTLTFPVEMKIGGLAETVLVTGDTPVVDVQNAQREMVIRQDVIESLPGARAAGSLLNVTPGLQVDNNGLALSPTMTFFNAHSSTANSTSVAGEGRMAVNGFTVAAARSGGVSSYVYDTANAQEVALTVGGGLGESDIGGPVMNVIPRAGGNRFAGTAFLNVAGDWSRSNNLDDRLRSFGLTQTPGIISSYDTSASLGGPIKRDRLWFYGSYRNLDTQTAIEGINANANAGDPTRWDWVGSPISARQVQDRQMWIGRLTTQLGKNRLQVNSEYQHRCEGTPLKVDTDGCHKRGDDWIGLGNNTAPFMSPESTSTAARGYFDVPYWLTQASWNLPLTSKILLDAGYTGFRYNPLFGFPPPDGITDLIPVTEQSNAINPATGLRYAPQPNYTYRALEQWGWAVGRTDGYSASFSYVTGAHSLKAGYQGNRLDQLDQTLTNANQVAYRFNQGVPNAVTYRLPDFGNRTLTILNGLYIQDSWTRNRLTLQGALRYDRASSYSPVDGNGTTRTSFLNSSPITFPVVKGVNSYNDITPRIGVAYDVFGTGKTALKFNWGHYLAYAANDAPYTSSNPAVTVPRVVTNRGWTDNNGNKIVDCDLTNPALQSPAATGSPDTCAALTGNDINFGKPGAATIVNPDVLHGWGVRPSDYQSTITVQQEIVPRLSGEFSFTHRTFHGFFVTDNLSRHVGGDISGDVAPFYETYTLQTPVDSRLPGGGGYPITVYTVAPAFATVSAKNYLTKESDYGPERDSHWNGFDVTLNARLRAGLVTSVGSSTGRAVVDTCATVTKLGSNPDPRGCHNVDPFQTTWRGLATYTIPKVDVLVSATVRSQPPLPLTAGWQVPNALVQAMLGHLPSNALLSGNTTIQLTDNSNKLFVDNRRTQVDMRFAKVLRLVGTKTDVGVDLNNLFNTNYATSYNTTYANTVDGGTWGNPTAIYAPRFVRLNFTINY
jgi:hypothetical protein